MQYTALQILASFGPRRSDIWRLGRQHLVEPTEGRGWHFKFVTQKTGITIEVPVSEAVAETIAANPVGELMFLRTSTGRPFKSGNALANWFKKALREAKLPDDLSLHGMRKYCATRYAIHSTELQLQAIFGCGLTPMRLGLTSRPPTSCGKQPWR
ncbi:MAG: tyrosine-type recombinase/integrase [Alphaproteobacteria bacterium]